MKQSIKFQRVSLFRRICSIIFDGIIAVSLFVVLFAVAGQPIVSSVTDYDQVYEKYNAELLSTNLYIYFEENDAVSLISSKYDENLTKFYNSNKLGYDSEDYYKLKYEVSNINPTYEGEPIFIYNEVNDSFIENIYELDSSNNITDKIDQNKQQKINEFYRDLLNKLNEEILNQEIILEYTQKLTALTMLMFFIAIIPSILIVYLLIPMLNKDGATIGKKMLQMRLINAKNGQNVSKFFLFYRFVFFCLLNVLLGIFTYGLSIIISIGLMFFFKTRQSLHDLVAGTMIVCNTYSESNNVNKSEIIEIVYDDGKIEDEETLNQ